MAKTVYTALNLKDNMSGGILKVCKNMKNMSKEAKRASQQVVHMADNFQRKVSSMASSAGKLIKAGTGIASAFALKTGLAEAMDLEGFRTQLETATKDAKRAGEVMKYSINLANKTPFEGGELVDAASSLEMFGLRTERWLPVLGDAAAGVNRSMADVKSGFIKAATTGDFASLRDTLGVTKEMVAEFAKTNLGGTFLNSKGQITDTKLLQDALEGLLSSRYAGGMEKLATTTKGVWSTITGVTKNGLARIVGMQNDGTVQSGSLLDYLKTKATAFGGLLEKWQSDGTMDRIASKFSKGFQRMVKSLKSATEFAAEHKQTILTVGSALAGVFAGAKLASGIKNLYNGFQSIKKVLGVLKGGFLMFSPTGWIVIGITALVAAFTLAYQKSETFRNKVQALWANFKEFAAGLKSSVVPKLQELRDWFGVKILPTFQKIAPCVQLVWSKVQPFAEWMGQIFAAKIGNAFQTVKNIAGTAFDGIKSLIEGFTTVLDGLISFITGVFTGNWGQAWNGIKTVFSGVFESFGTIAKTPLNLIIDGINHLIGQLNAVSNVEVPDWVPGLGGKSFGLNIPQIPHFALGTQYFSGGLARIHERGGEIVNLPNGSKVIPADKSRKAVGGTVINLHLIVQGNIIGNTQYADYLGGVIAKKVKTALANT